MKPVKVAVLLDDLVEDVELDGHTVVDFTALVDLPWEGMALKVEALNIADEHYRTRQYYDMPGREARVSLLIGWEDDGGH